jgi:tetratricopeptide (TPR) repeat protein/DNA-binding XRE family transcriptional regulator
MTDTPGIEKFYGAAILLLRWCVRRWGREKLAAKSGVSAASIFNYEKGKTVPGPERHKKIADALQVSLADLDHLATAVRTGLSGLHAQGAERRVNELTAPLVGEFRRGARPLVAQLLSSQALAPPPSSDEAVRALLPVLGGIDVAGLELLVQAPSLRRLAFVMLVGEASERAASTHARRALELANFALSIAERMEGEEGWQARSFAWAFVGNARRVGSDLDGAEEAFADSARLRGKCSDELPEAWRLFDLEASLRIDLRQLPEGLRLLDQAEELAPRISSIRARLLGKQSNALEQLGDSEGSIAALRRGAALVDREAEPHLLWMLHFNLMDSLCSVGKAAEAEGMLPELRLLQAKVGNGLNQIRLRWLEGKIAGGQGRIDEAIEALSTVRAAFAKDDIRYDEALASMELAGLYLRKGRPAEVKRLVLQMEPVFRAKGVHAEAKKALALFRRAVEMETVTPELAGRVAGYLRRAQHDPELRFEEAA